jgi:hypothetical protein
MYSGALYITAIGRAYKGLGVFSAGADQPLEADVATLS